jgi:hypothetical protein
MAWNRSCRLGDADLAWKPCVGVSAFDHRPGADKSGTYLLATMNGSADLTFEYSWFDQRVVERVLFDSITFFDGVYYRRHRAERNVAVTAAGDSLRGGNEFLTFGSYCGADAVLVLRDYRQPSLDVRAVDSLAVDQEALVRRIPRLHPETRVSFIWEDVYHRRR